MGMERSTKQTHHNRQQDASRRDNAHPFGAPGSGGRAGTPPTGERLISQIFFREMNEGDKTHHRTQRPSCRGFPVLMTNKHTPL